MRRIFNIYIISEYTLLHVGKYISRCKNIVLVAYYYSICLYFLFSRFQFYVDIR